jgi:hypothetical protein
LRGTFSPINILSCPSAPVKGTRKVNSAVIVVNFVDSNVVFAAGVHKVTPPPPLLAHPGGLPNTVTTHPVEDVYNINQHSISMATILLEPLKILKLE